MRFFYCQASLRAPPAYGLLIFVLSESGGGVKAGCRYSFAAQKESPVKPPAWPETNYCECRSCKMRRNILYRTRVQCMGSCVRYFTSRIGTVVSEFWKPSLAWGNGTIVLYLKRI